MAWDAKSTLRQSVLAIVMLAILLAATGWAWLMVRSGQRRQDVGAQIVQSIHTQKLSHWYPEKAQVQWLLASQGGKIVGWQAIVRSSADGKHEGLRIESDGPTPPATKEGFIEKWSLDDTATTGQYESKFIAPGVSNAGATIQLENGKVRMTQLFPHLMVADQASGDAPANYLPEGTTDLALRLVAQQQADGLFARISDTHPNEGKRIDFLTARIRYAGKGTGDSSALNKVILAAGGEEETYWLTAEGEIKRIDTHSGPSWTQATEQQVAEHYPSAPAQVQQLSENILPQKAGFWKRLFGVTL